MINSLRNSITEIALRNKSFYELDKEKQDFIVLCEMQILHTLNISHPTDFNRMKDTIDTQIHRLIYECEKTKYFESKHYKKHHSTTANANLKLVDK